MQIAQDIFGVDFDFADLDKYDEEEDEEDYEDEVCFLTITLWVLGKVGALSNKGTILLAYFFRNKYSYSCQTFVI